MQLYPSFRRVAHPWKKLISYWKIFVLWNNPEFLYHNVWGFQGFKNYDSINLKTLSIVWKEFPEIQINSYICNIEQNICSFLKNHNPDSVGTFIENVRVFSQVLLFYMWMLWTPCSERGLFKFLLWRMRAQSSKNSLNLYV